jgi:DNA-binding GntR family transcriptional regulator
MLTGLTAPERQDLVEEIASQLRALILSGTIPPGSRLRQEEVAAHLGVSRTPLREAFRVLTHEGLLVQGSIGGSLEVCPLTERHAQELYEVREVVDGLAARLCAERHETLPIDELRSSVEAIENASDPFSKDAFHAAHVKFHRALLSATGNQVLAQLRYIIEISSLMVLPHLEVSPQRVKLSAREHAHVLQCVQSGDPRSAEQAAREHIHSASEFWVKRMGAFADDGAG